MIAAIVSRTRSVLPDQAQGATRLRVIPILDPSQEEPAYRLLEADVLPAVKVTEVSSGGSVPQLRVVNTLEARVLLTDGQELVEANPCGILNTEVLVLTVLPNVGAIKNS